MRVLLDTNVLIAAFVAKGVCHRLFEHCIRHHTIVTSEFILDELREKLTKKLRYATPMVEEAIDLVVSGSELVGWVPLPEAVCRDRDDDAVLAAAVSGQCDLVITGDEDLLILKSHAGVEIVSPAVFMAREQAAAE